MAARHRARARPVPGNRRFAAAACVRALACAPPAAGGNGRGSPAAADRCPVLGKSDATAPPPRECDRRKWSGGGRDRISLPRRRAVVRRRRNDPHAVAAAARGHGAARGAAAVQDPPGEAPDRRPWAAVRDSAGRCAEAAALRCRCRGHGALARRRPEPMRWAPAAVRTRAGALSPRERDVAQPVAAAPAPDAVRQPPRQGGTHVPALPRPTRVPAPWAACA